MELKPSHLQQLQPFLLQCFQPELSHRRYLHQILLQSAPEQQVLCLNVQVHCLPNYELALNEYVIRLHRREGLSRGMFAHYPKRLKLTLKQIILLPQFLPLARQHHKKMCLQESDPAKSTLRLEHQDRYSESLDPCRGGLT